MLNRGKIEEIKRFFFEDEDIINDIRKELKNKEGNISDEEIGARFNNLISNGYYKKNISCVDKKSKQVNHSVIELTNQQPVNPICTKETKTKRKNYTTSEVLTVWRNIYDNEFDNVLCKLCESTKISIGDRRLWHMSHIISHEAGGTPDISNIRPLCTICNHSMHKKSLLDYCKEKFDTEKCKKIFSVLKIL